MTPREQPMPLTPADCPVCSSGDPCMRGFDPLTDPEGYCEDSGYCEDAWHRQQCPFDAIRVSREQGER